MLDCDSPKGAVASACARPAWPRMSRVDPDVSIQVNLIQITPGAGGMYCGNCFRDNALVSALRRQGHETVMVPLYLPMTLDESPAAGQTPTFFGGINVYLSQVSSLYRRAPAVIRSLFDSPKLLKWAAGKAAKTRAEDVGELTLSMLQGENGNQARELEEMIGWLETLPRPDAVYLSNALLVGFARELRSRLKTRVICFLQSEETFLDSIHEPEKTNCWKTLCEQGKAIDGWIAPTHYFADRMARRLEIPQSKLQVVPNGIQLEGYRDIQRPVGSPPSLGFFARMCPDKGLDIVVDAFIEVRRRSSVPGLQLRIGGGCGPGDEPFVARQKSKLSAAGLSDAVSFHPNVTRQEKIEFLSRCSVLSVPARMSEAFGLYLIESMAAGTPVLQPDVCGYREIIEATGGGVHYPENTPGALANAVEQLFKDPARMDSLGKTARTAIADRYTDDAMARGILAATRQFTR